MQPHLRHARREGVKVAVVPVAVFNGSPSKSGVSCAACCVPELQNDPQRMKGIPVPLISAACILVIRTIICACHPLKEVDAVA